MSILKLRYIFTGYLIISVQGAATEKFINLAIRQGIPLWDIRRGEGQAVLKTDIYSFFDMRHLAAKTGCRLRIVRKAGFPFLWTRMLRRRGLAAGLCLFVVTLYVLSSFILFVSVQGNERLDEEHIRQLAVEAGIRPGLLKSKLDKDEAANRLIDLEPEIAWVGIEVRGTRLVIEVVEKIERPEETDQPAHIVAAKDGIIVDILPITGEVRVKPGDTVTRGQLLIEGVLQPQSQYTREDEEDGTPQAVPIRARGDVLARVWYEGYGEAALTEVDRTRSGRRTITYTLLVEGQPVLRIGRPNVHYADFERDSANRRILERILHFPVELLTETVYEIERTETELTYEQALELAAERARMLAELQLPVDAEITETTVDELDLDREGFVGVRYVIETRENIAEEKLIFTGGD
ncbi:MAG: sporulation protein YqfD [Bacillota bacterium]|nr:sporulation protein YqfD [Bacillota bacterium]MDW7683477.1 sporulation protein YqfD [Bacillota bacterium]